MSFNIGSRVLEVDVESGEVFFDLAIGTVEAIETSADGQQYFFVKWDGNKRADAYEYARSELYPVK